MIWLIGKDLNGTLDQNSAHDSVFCKFKGLNCLKSDMSFQFHWHYLFVVVHYRLEGWRNIWRGSMPLGIGCLTSLAVHLYVIILNLFASLPVWCCYLLILYSWSLFMQAPKPSSGPHKSRECLPLILILRNRLKYALTYREVIAILMQRHVMVDGKVKTDKTYPSGFMGM